MSSVLAHENASRRRSIWIGLGVDLDLTHATFLPFRIKAKKLSWSDELGGLVFLARFD